MNDYDAWCLINDVLQTAKAFGCFRQMELSVSKGPDDIPATPVIADYQSIASG
jgi:hypothetical protein